MSQDIEQRKTEIFSKILQALTAMATAAKTLEPGKIFQGSLPGLQVLLAEQDQVRFNEDMVQCVTMTSEYRYLLEPSVVATGMLVHYAQFLATQLGKGLEHYDPAGVPTQLMFEIDHQYMAVAQITWAYSVKGAI
ncbi:hypothetical protein LUCX_230 [Xanthomonas phage vB_XciM_LucasX]|nr:hypothetical protein LUCX_230 [Xanthomonas phage vB_XciM_LucasX]